MRIRSKKLVYLPIGGALAASLLASAFVTPQAQLVASQDCYGVCHSATTLSLSESTVTVGRESREVFSVRVSASAPVTGSVEVKTGPRALCHISLSNGKGHCSLANKELAPGSYEVKAVYSGNSNLRPSTSASKHLTVLKVSSETALSLSRAAVTVGRESREVFSVRVSASAPVTGSVEVKTGPRTLCHVSLSNGKGHCSLGNKELAPGSYEVKAVYSGNAHLGPSTSASEHLTVHKR